jgi:ketosteroid isomerase-like protein
MATATEVLCRAITASATGDTAAIKEYYAPDVVGWSAGEDIASVQDLIAEAITRGGALSEITVAVQPMQLPSGQVAAEWRLTARHTGPLRLDDELEIEPTGRRLELRGAVFAQVTDGQVADFRQYWDPADMLEQLGLMDEPPVYL